MHKCQIPFHQPPQIITSLHKTKAQNSKLDDHMMMIQGACLPGMDRAVVNREKKTFVTPT